MSGPRPAPSIEELRNSLARICSLCMLLERIDSIGQDPIDAEIAGATFHALAELIKPIIRDADKLIDKEFGRAKAGENAT